MHYISLIFIRNVKRFFKAFVIALSLSRNRRRPAYDLFPDGLTFLAPYFAYICYLFCKVLYILFPLGFYINVIP